MATLIGVKYEQALRSAMEHMQALSRAGEDKRAADDAAMLAQTEARDRQAATRP